MQSPRAKHLPFTEPQQMSNERCGALGRPLNALNLITQGIVLLQAAQKQGAISADDGEDISELVSDSSRQPADSFHLLRSPQLFFQAAPFRNVTRHALDRHGYSVFVNRACADLQGNDSAVLPDELERIYRHCLLAGQLPFHHLVRNLEL